MGMSLHSSRRTRQTKDTRLGRGGFEEGDEKKLLSVMASKKSRHSHGGVNEYDQEITFT